MAEMGGVMRIAKRHDLVVIEDAAQAIGAEHEGTRAGSIGHYGCFSFFPSKNLGAAGDAGMVVTNHDERADKLRSLRDHGSNSKYYHKIVGGNFRLDALQAAVVTAKLPHLDDWTRGRQNNAQRYSELLSKNACEIEVPKVTSGRHIFNQYVIRSPERDNLQAFLSNSGIGTEIYYPVPLHLQECFSYLGYSVGDFPESEKAAKETLALPIYPELEPAQIEYVASRIVEFRAAHSCAKIADGA